MNNRSTSSKILDPAWISLSMTQFAENCAGLVGGMDPVRAAEIFDDICGPTAPVITQKLIFSCATAALTTSNQTHEAIAQLVEKLRAGKGIKEKNAAEFQPTGQSGNGFALRVNMTTVRLIGHIAIQNAKCHGDINKWVATTEIRGSPFAPKAGESEYMKICQESAAEHATQYSTVRIDLQTQHIKNWMDLTPSKK